MICHYYVISEPVREVSMAAKRWHQKSFSSDDCSKDLKESDQQTGLESKYCIKESFFLAKISAKLSKITTFELTSPSRSVKADWQECGVVASSQWWAPATVELKCWNYLELFVLLYELGLEIIITEGSDYQHNTASTYTGRCFCASVNNTPGLTPKYLIPIPISKWYYFVPTEKFWE